MIPKKGYYILRFCIYLQIFLFAVFFYHTATFNERVWPRIQHGYLWATGVARYNFRPTADETACYDGTVSRINAPNVTEHIPNVVHFVWGPSGAPSFPFTLYLAMRAALLTLRPDVLKLHYTYVDMESPWFQKLAPNITLEHHEPTDYLERFADRGAYAWDIAHMADVLRLTVLLDQGGVYLDQDVYALRPFTRQLEGRRDVVMGHEGGNRAGLTNAVILAKKGAPFIDRWLGRYSDFEGANWNYHSVLLPRQMEKEHPDELCALSPSAFFWPMWNPVSVDWMHVPLSPDEVVETERIIKETGGALFGDQLAHHAWSHGARKYLERLTPEVMRAEDTRFNLLMRRFLED